MMKQGLDISKIVQYKLSDSEYYKESFPKKQIYLHHTVSHPNPRNVIDGWKQQEFRIATAFVIAGKPYKPNSGFDDGDIFQCFGSAYWSLHLASHGSGNRIPAKYKTKEVTRELEKMAIGIEICSAGWLTWENGKFYSSFRSIIPEDQVIEYVDKYRGQRFFHKYTDAQIENVRQLLIYLCDKYGIPKTYQTDMWDISVNALSGQPGIFTHTSVRSDKTDCHPQPELVRMLIDLGQTAPQPAVAAAATANNNTATTANTPAGTLTDASGNPLSAPTVSGDTSIVSTVTGTE